MNMNGIYVDLVFDTLLDVIACKDLKDGMDFSSEKDLFAFFLFYSS